MLGIAIVLEVFGSTMLKLSDGFRRKLPILGVILGYGLCFYLLSLVLLVLPLGFTYAVWSALGTIFTAMIGVFFFKEHLNAKGIFGIGLLIFGMVLLHISQHSGSGGF